MRVSWLACFDPATGTDRMCTWIGDVVKIVVTGLPPGFARNAPATFELPAGAAIHGVTPADGGRELARQLGGVLFTVFRKDAIELLLEAMTTPRTFVKLPDGYSLGVTGRFIERDRPRMREHRDPPTMERFEPAPVPPEVWAGGEIVQLYAETRCLADEERARRVDHDPGDEQDPNVLRGVQSEVIQAWLARQWEPEELLALVQLREKRRVLEYFKSR